MSYILNAIRKSEQDRQTQGVSNSENALLETQPKQNSRLRWPIAVLIILNILTLIYFIYTYLWQQPATTKNQLPATVPPSQSEKPQITLNTTIEQPKPESVAPMRVPPATKPVQKKSISKMLKQHRTLKKPVPKPVVKKIAEVTKKTTSIHLTTPRPTPVKTKQESVRPHPAQVVSKPKKTRKIPFLREMAPAFRRNVPKLIINVFVYAENPDDRFVIIDMKKYRTGHDIAEGMKIKEIRNNSLILLYNNRTFQVERP